MELLANLICISKSWSYSDCSVTPYTTQELKQSEQVAQLHAEQTPKPTLLCKQTLQVTISELGLMARVQEPQWDSAWPDQSSTKCLSKMNESRARGRGSTAMSNALRNFTGHSGVPIFLSSAEPSGSNCFCGFVVYWAVVTSLAKQCEHML